MKKLTIVSLCISLSTTPFHANGMTDWGEVYADFPRLCKEMSENMDNVDLCAGIMEKFVEIDGINRASPGHPEALELARKALRRNPYSPVCEYLMWKGNESDIELLEKAHEVMGVEIPFYPLLDALCVLRERLTGYSYAEGRDINSFANTGPQEVYLLEIRRKIAQKIQTTWDPHYYGRIEERDRLSNLWNTMVVSFDAGGNPVCNVDLEEYGFSMPIITPKPHPSIPYYRGYPNSEYTVVFPHETTNAPSTDATLNSPPAEGCPKGGVVPNSNLGTSPIDPPPSVIAKSGTAKRSILLIGIGILALIVIIGGVTVWKNAKRRKAP